MFHMTSHLYEITFMWDLMGSHSYGISFIWDLIHIDVQPIAFGVSFHLNLLGLFLTERGKRDLEN